MSDIDHFILRYNDFSLSDEHTLLADTYRTFLEKHCTPERVRASEPLGYDADLWERLTELKPVATGLSEACGGDGGGLLELALIAEQLGRFAAPVPLLDTVVVARLLAQLDSPRAKAVLQQLLEGSVASIALTEPDRRTGRHLVGAGAVAAYVVAMHEGRLVLTELDEQPLHVQNLACAPLAWCELAGGEVLADGDAAPMLYELVRREWLTLMAAALSGVGEASKTLGVQYAKDRTAFGVPIGTFQAVAHPLVDIANAVEGARRLARKAAWFLDFEPGTAGPLPSMAFLHASEAAESAGMVAIHTQGGFGFTLESDVQLFYRRAKGWPLLAGDRRQEYQQIADRLFPVVTTSGGQCG